MRPITTRAQLYGPSTGLSYGGAQGNSQTTQKATQTAVPVTTLFNNLRGSILAQPILWLAGLVLFLVGWKLIEEKRGEREEFSEVKIGVSNWAKIGFMMLLFFAAAKFLATKYDVPGASKLVLYATS